jgi:membrane protease YdiL (CAAX protease family)
MAAPGSARTAPARSSVPPAHVIALIALLVAVASTGAVLSLRHPTAFPVATPSREIAYPCSVVVSWALQLYVSRFGRHRSALRSLLGMLWERPIDAVVDVWLAAVTAASIGACELAWSKLFRAGAPLGRSALLPVTPLEHVAWVAVASSAGFCEEVVYRGYLQKELSALTRRPNLALWLQALLFAIAHGEQGPGAVARGLLYGLGLGLLARARGSLIPGIICHMGLDLAAGFVGPGA